MSDPTKWQGGTALPGVTVDNGGWQQHPANGGLG